MTSSTPSPQPNDSGEVTEALDVAGKLWSTGNRQDAIRWVRRAAQAADDAGDSQRMTALARASADLEESLAAAAPIRSSTPPPLPTRPASSPPPDKSDSSPPAPLELTRVKAKATPPPLPAQASRPPPPASTTPPKANYSAAPATTPKGSRSPEPSTPPKANHSPAPAPTTTPAKGRMRIRVSIKTSALDPTLLVVRRLEDGKALPAGTNEGWLETAEMAEPASVDTKHANGKSVR